MKNNLIKPCKVCSLSSNRDMNNYLVDMFQRVFGRMTDERVVALEALPKILTISNPNTSRVLSGLLQ